MKQGHSKHSDIRKCEEKSTLLNKYIEATEVYLDSLSVLSARIGVIDRAEYDRLRQATENYRMKSEQARLSLDSHAGSHGC